MPSRPARRGFGSPFAEMSLPPLPSLRSSLLGEGGLFLGTLCLGVILAGCGTVKSPTEPAPEEPGGAAFSFSTIQVEIFSPTCAKAGCHAASAASAALVLEAGRAYGELVGRPATQNGALHRVEPGAPERSYLLSKLRGDPAITGGRMPLDGPPYLTPEQIEGIAAWILAGAPND